MPKGSLRAISDVWLSKYLEFVTAMMNATEANSAQIVRPLPIGELHFFDQGISLVMTFLISTIISWFPSMCLDGCPTESDYEL